ncbi:hypothetical protein CDL12_28503 [Handroanthus impetiginosus]|uniref:Uncharacterized protein n=1 Tax=Handroanthus impetiginosus TaxID=429701 RepID=A0A2G9G149_9LAMI|nr:hypothetical protein CDL12_28503 [Handroanthus impetiginosus]
MADAIVSIALERLANIVVDKIGDEIGLVRGVKKEVPYLSSELTAIRNVLEDAEKRGLKGPRILLRLGRRYKLATRRGIAMKIKGLRERLDVIVKEKNRYDFIVGEVVDHQGSDRVRATSSVDVKEIQGQETVKDVLVSKLILALQKYQDLIHLRYLDLSGEKLTVQVLQTICNLYNWQALYLRKCGMEEILREMENLIHLSPSNICKLCNFQALYLHDCGLKEIPKEMGSLIHLRHLDLSLNVYIEELPETICNLNDLQTLNLEHCERLSRLPKEIHRLVNLRHLLNHCTNGICQIPQGIERLTALRTLRLFQARRGWKLRITMQDEEGIMEAQKAELRSKKHIKYEEEASLKQEAMEALQPQPNLYHLTILDYQSIKFPNWITSSLNLLRVPQIHECNYCLTLPPLGKLPCLEEVSVWIMDWFQFLSREFLGISGNNDGSMPSSAVVIGFPKLKKLSFRLCYRWKEWEDVTAEEAMNTALSIMPCLQELYIDACEITALPHRLLHKASALEHLKIRDSSYLSQRYEDKNGSGFSSLSHIPHHQCLTHR